MVAILLTLSTIEAFRIQSSLTDEAVTLYHRHLNQDDLLVRLRRTLWLGANGARDFLLDASGERELRFRTRLAELQSESAALLNELTRWTFPAANIVSLRVEIKQFWTLLEGVPAATSNLSTNQRYGFIQEEVLPKRSALTERVRDFTAANQAALKHAEAEFAQTRRYAATRLLGVITLSLLLALGVSWLSLAHARRLERKTLKQYDEVARAKADLQRLSMRLMEIQEDERTRLSRELHDEIGQTLATLRLELSRASSLPEVKSPQLVERLTRAREFAERTLRTVRDISLLLRPALLDDLGLRPAVQWQTEEFTRRCGVPCEFRDDGLEDTLPDAVKTAVYRIVQESLHNCEKYADAVQVLVTISQTDRELLVRVEDDGKGFRVVDETVTTPENARGLGILGMRERATAVNGILTIESSLGSGTRLTLRVPISSSKAEIATATVA